MIQFKFGSQLKNDFIQYYNDEKSMAASIMPIKSAMRKLDVVEKEFGMSVISTNIDDATTIFTVASLSTLYASQQRMVFYRLYINYARSIGVCAYETNPVEFISGRINRENIYRMKSFSSDEDFFNFIDVAFLPVEDADVTAIRRVALELLYAGVALPALKTGKCNDGVVTWDGGVADLNLYPNIYKDYCELVSLPSVTTYVVNLKLEKTYVLNKNNWLLPVVAKQRKIDTKGVSVWVNEACREYNLSQERKQRKLVQKTVTAGDISLSGLYTRLLKAENQGIKLPVTPSPEYYEWKKSWGY